MAEKHKTRPAVARHRRNRNATRGARKKAKNLEKSEDRENAPIQMKINTPRLNTSSKSATQSQSHLQNIKEKDIQEQSPIAHGSQTTVMTVSSNIPLLLSDEESTESIEGTESEELNKMMAHGKELNWIVNRLMANVKEIIDDKTLKGEFQGSARSRVKSAYRETHQLLEKTRTKLGNLWERMQEDSEKGESESP